MTSNSMSRDHLYLLVVVAAGIAPASRIPQVVIQMEFVKTAPRGCRKGVGTVWHFRSLSPLGMAWHRKSGRRSWIWCGVLGGSGGEPPPPRVARTGMASESQNPQDDSLRGGAPNGQRPVIGVLDSHEGVMVAALVGVVAFRQEEE